MQGNPVLFFISILQISYFHKVLKQKVDNIINTVYI